MPELHGLAVLLGGFASGAANCGGACKPAGGGCCLFPDCEVCDAGPTGRCDPPDDFDGECPHGCSPER